jgi:hypothetical protein
MWGDRLRGAKILNSSNNNVQNGAADPESQGATFSTANQTGYFYQENYMAYSGRGYILYKFKRAPSFFDEVCISGTTSDSTAIPHNLGAVPELIIAKSRTTTSDWAVYSSALGQSKFLQVNTTGAAITFSNVWGSVPQTSTNFYVNGTYLIGNDGVFYLFATCPGVSKVGSYTGTGTLTTVNCGFTGGARWVMIKETSGTGDWYVWDTARGMVSGTDPSMKLNLGSTEAGGNSVFTIATGFQLAASPVAPVNTNGGTYIFLAIA